MGVALLAAASWACGNMVVKHAGEVDILAFLVWSSLFSVPPPALLAWYFHGLDGIAHDLSLASWRLGGGVMAKCRQYPDWLRSVEYAAQSLPGGDGHPRALLVPVFGMSASALLLSETLYWWKLLAGR